MLFTESCEFYKIFNQNHRGKAHEIKGQNEQMLWNKEISIMRKKRVSVMKGYNVPHVEASA